MSTSMLDHHAFDCCITTNCSKGLWELTDILLSQKHLVHSVYYLCYKCRHQQHTEHLQQVKSPSSQRVTVFLECLSSHWEVTVSLRLLSLSIYTGHAYSGDTCTYLQGSQIQSFVLTPDTCSVTFPNITTLTMGLWREAADLKRCDVHSSPAQIVQKHYTEACTEHFMLNEKKTKTLTIETRKHYPIIKGMAKQ